MHFFDPTLDWPPELIREEIPDLLYLRSDHSLDLSSRIHFSDPSSFVSSTTPWTEYTSLDGIQSLTLLFVDVEYVQQQSAEQEIRSLLEDLRAQHVEIGRYRKIQHASTSARNMPATVYQIWCWAFRSLSQPTLRPSLMAFESFAKAALSSTSYMQSTVYRVLASDGSEQSTIQGVPHSLIIHHIDDIEQSPRTATSSQEFLQEHSILEKTILNHSTHQQLAFTNAAWTDAMPLLS